MTQLFFAKFWRKFPWNIKKLLSKIINWSSEIKVIMLIFPISIYWASSVKNVRGHLTHQEQAKTQNLTHLIMVDLLGQLLFWNHVFEITKVNPT